MVTEDGESQASPTRLPCHAFGLNCIAARLLLPKPYYAMVGVSLLRLSPTAVWDGVESCSGLQSATATSCTFGNTAGGGRLLAEVANDGTRSNVTFTIEQAVAQHPQFHITPHFGWMNDPNGMFQLGALYHIFYQYNPAAGE